MSVLATLVLALLPQGEVHGRGDRLVVPRSTTAPTGGPQDPRDGRAESFERMVHELRRSKHLPSSDVSSRLSKIGSRYPDAGARAARLLSTADADLAHACALVLERFGSADHAREIEYQLQTRKFGSATRELLGAMASIARDPDLRAELLFGSLTASRARVRSGAEEVLADRLRPVDADRLIELSRQGRKDVQLKALRLLGNVPPSRPVRDRLTRALAQDPGLAQAAIEALVAHGPDAASDLQQILRMPAVGRNFGYAAVALVLLEQRHPGVELLTPDMRPTLLTELEMPDAFQQCAVALGLAGLAWRSDDPVGPTWRDRDVAGTLIGVVDPRSYIDHYAMVKPLAQERLALLIGRDLGPERGAWRNWWTSVAELPRFLAARRSVRIDEANAGSAELIFSGHPFRIICSGPDASATPSSATAGTPAAGGDDADRVEDLQLVFGREDLRQLVAALQDAGFMQTVNGGGTATDGETRFVQLIAGGALARSQPGLPSARLDRFEALFEAALAGNRWQLYRDPQAHPDAAAFWRSQQRWLDEHPEQADRERRLLDLLLPRLASLQGPRRALALEHLLAVEDLGERLTADDGLALAECAAGAETWNESTIRILELAMLAPGEEVWQRLLGVAEQREVREPGIGALSRLFSLATAEQVIAAATKSSDYVRIVAIEELSRLRDLDALPSLRGWASDTAESLEVRRAAVYALGQYRDPSGIPVLTAMLGDDIGASLDGELRRSVWIALGRIGGEEAFQALSDAISSVNPLDRRAVVQGFGAMRDPRAAGQLASVMVVRGDDTLGQLAQEYLRRMGDLLASPALQTLLVHPNAAVRRRSALLLGEFQNPAAIPELRVLLEEQAQRVRVAALLADTTGLELVASRDRVPAFNAWWDRWRVASQESWYLEALRIAGVEHSLQSSQLTLGAGVGAVPELCRLAQTLESRHLRALTGRMLRQATREDYGAITGLSTPEQVAAIVTRYRFLHDSSQAVDGRR